MRLRFLGSSPKPSKREKGMPENEFLKFKLKVVNLLWQTPPTLSKLFHFSPLHIPAFSAIKFMKCWISIEDLFDTMIDLSNAVSLLSITESAAGLVSIQQLIEQ